MPYSQGNLVYLKHPIPLPDGKELVHPVLIISSNASNSYENRYTGVMMSSTAHKDRFSFQCSNEMFESPLQKSGSQFRTYIILGFNEDQISRLVNQMKPIHLGALLAEIRNYIFCKS